MNVFKIVIGIIITIAAGSEYVSASRQLGTLIAPGILIGTIVLLLFSFWLITSGFSTRKYHLSPKNIITSSIIILVTFAITILFNIASKPTPSHFAIINGIKVPLGKCINGNVKVIPDLKEREVYCECFVEKITNEPDLKLKFQSKLENDRIDEVFKEIQTSSTYLELRIEDCLASIKIEWTDEVVKGMKQSIKKELYGSGFETTNNFDTYCDCLTDEYRKYPLNNIMADDFYESQLAIEIDEKCTKASLKY